jgi:hypothetical protein
MRCASCVTRGSRAAEAHYAVRVTGRGRRLTALVALLALGALAGLGAAQAAKPRPRISPEASEPSRRAAAKVAHAIADRRQARSAAWASRPPYGNPAGISTKPLAGFPTAGRTFAILATGNVLLADNANSSPSSGSNAGGPTIRGSRDVTIFRVNLRVPRGANCLSVRFRFLSEEFPEFVGEEFNDGFIAELDETTWDTNTIGSPVIDADRNFATDSAGNIISVNSADPANVAASNAQGTTYDAATRVLRASTPITPGRHRLYLSLFDQGDRQYDSAVFLDQLTLTREATCRTGVVAA